MLIVAKMKATSMITPDTPYGVLVLFDGSNFQLFIDNILVLTLPAAATPNGTVGFQVKGTSGTFDEIVVN